MKSLHAKLNEALKSLTSLLTETEEQPQEEKNKETKTIGAALPKVADVFKIEEKDNKKYLTEILKDKDGDADKFADNVTKTKDGKTYFLKVKEDGQETEYIFGEKLIETAKNKYPKAKVKEEDNADENPYNLPEAFRKLGESIALVAISGLTKGKMKGKIDIKSDNLAEAVDSSLIKDRYKIVFKDIESFDDKYFDEHTIYDIMEDCAARSAYFEAKKVDKLGDGEYVVKGNDNKIEKFNTDVITSDGATKSFYEKTLSNFQNEFDEGVKAAKEQCEKNKDGGKIKDPITNKTIEMPEEGAIKHMFKAMGSNVGGFAMDALGITSGKDVYSMMIRGIVGQFKEGSSVRKLLAQASKARYNKVRKLKVSIIKGHINETAKAIEDAKKQGGIPK